jgi:hypothetical protein
MYTWKLAQTDAFDNTDARNANTMDETGSLIEARTMYGAVGRPRIGRV